MILSPTKIIWGYIEELTNRVSNYRVFIRKDFNTIETTTNDTGFYQLNLGNIGLTFNNGDNFFVETIGPDGFYGSNLVTIVNGTTTQQAPTIQVSRDGLAPQVLAIQPDAFSNSSTPNIVIDILDLESGPNIEDILIKFDSRLIVNSGRLVDTSFRLVLEQPSRERLVIKLEGTLVSNDDSIHSIIALIGDNAGNILSVNHSFKTDLSKPSIISFSPDSRIFVSNRYQPISVVISDSISGINESSIILSIDGVDYNIYWPNIEYTNGIVTFTPSIPYPNTSVIEWKFIVSDIAGNELNFSSSFVVFANPPRIINIIPSPGLFANDSCQIIRFGFEEGSSDIDITTFIMSVNGETIIAGDSRLNITSSGGIFVPNTNFSDIVEVSLKIKDTLGLEDAVSFLFYIDTNSPEIGFIQPRPGEYLPTPLSALRFTATDIGSGIDPSSIVVTVNGESFTTSTGQVYFSAGIIVFVPTKDYRLDNENIVVVQASDKAGNAAIPLELEFKIDEEPPHIISVIPSPGSIINDLLAPIEIRIIDNLSGIDPSTIVVLVNRVSFNASNPQYNFDGTSIRITPTIPYDENESVVVSLTVSDMQGNWLRNITVTSFKFDLIPPLIESIEPKDNSFTGAMPASWIIHFNENVDLTQVVLGRDIIIEAKSAIDTIADFETIEVSNLTRVDPFDRRNLIVIPEIQFQTNMLYRISLTNRIRDIANNKLGGNILPIGSVVFQSTFIFYQAGDLLIRGRISVSDIVKYSIFVDCCRQPLVTPLPELADLTGDGKIDATDLIKLQSIILEEDSVESISVAAVIPIEHIQIPIRQGSATEVNLRGFDSKPIADKTIGILSIPGADKIAGFQGDIVFDPNVLSIIDITPIIISSIFRYREISPGRIRILFVNVSGNIINDIAKIQFRIIGLPYSTIRIESVEVIDTGQATIPTTSNYINFITNITSPLISYISVIPDLLLIPTDARETSVIATLRGTSGEQILANSIPLEWTIIGNGFAFQTVTHTDMSGTSSNFIRLSGPASSSVQILVRARYDNSVSGTSEPIILFDSKLIGIMVDQSTLSAGTGEPIYMTAFVQTIGGLEFETRDIIWRTNSTNAIISDSGEFAAFSPGTYRVTATLKSDCNISATSQLITITSIIEFFDCNDQILPIDNFTGFSKLFLGHLFAGNKTGTQEVRIRNAMQSQSITIRNDILLNLDTDNARINLKTEFSPIIGRTLDLQIKNSDGNIQTIALDSGYFEMTLPEIAMDGLGPNGIATVVLPHVNITDVSIFNCGYNSCLGEPSRPVFINEKDSISEITVDGDFIIDRKSGKIIIKISSDKKFPGKISYRFEAGASIRLDTGDITIQDIDILRDKKTVFANYSFITGKLENIVLGVEDGPNTDITLSCDGINFNKNCSFEMLFPNKVSRFYIRANTRNGIFGVQSASIFVNADIMSFKNSP